MQTQRAELLRRLPEHGWRVAGEEENLEWWADEMWALESVWSPVGRRAYLTFLVDPQAGPNRRKGEAVWSVGATAARPSSRLSAEAEHTLDLGPGWRGRLPGFFERVATLRGRAEEGGGKATPA